MKQAVVALWVVLGADGLAAGEFDVVINEVNYNIFQQGQEAALEFVELHNKGPTEVDLGGWRFSRGITYTFDAGTTLASDEYLVVSPDPVVARTRFALERAAGPFSGRLDNDGEILELVNERGQSISRVHFGDSKPWPGGPDGLGPSLEYMGGDGGNDQARRWGASRFLNGTPGRPNSRREPEATLPPSDRAVLVAEDSVWATFRGTVEPSPQLGGWTRNDFNDANWERAPGGFGYGAAGGFTPSTQLNDMRFGYSTFYIRAGFEIAADTLAALGGGDATLELRVSYDDAFVAYLNGVEVGRANVGSPGVPLPAGATASSFTSDTATIPLAPFTADLVEGVNTLAVQGVNFTANNPDFFIGAELGLVETEVPDEPVDDDTDSLIEGVVNEILPSSGVPAGYVEFYNPTDQPLDLSGHALLSSRDHFFRLPPGTILAPGAFRTFSDAQLGFDVPGDDTVYLLFSSESRIVDALDAAPRGAGNSFGRFPDGDEDSFVMTQVTPGAANDYSFVSPVVVNEIHFHPPFVAPAGECSGDCSDAEQWIELYNFSGEPVDVGGWSLTKGVSFVIPQGTVLPAEDYLVIASSEAAFRAAHPGVGNVVGDWTRRLSHGSDTINLRDALGNRVDHVKYGDGNPLNDEQPEDGVDDRTFRGSLWPREADGSGRTIELIHPGLDNRSGVAWRSSLAQGGTPGTQNSTFDATPAPTIDDVRHAPLVPTSTDEVLVTCRLSNVAALAVAEIRWQVDGGGGAGTAPLRDDGLGGDVVAGDGRHGARLPPQADGRIVRFSVFVQDADGNSVGVPLQPEVSPYGGFPGASHLYEVDDSPPPGVGVTVYRIVMSGADRDELRDRPETSDVLLPVTVIGEGEAHHVVGLRFRGENSRRENNRSYRVDFPSERLFAGYIEHLNLNGSNGGQLGSQNVNELLSSDLLRRAGDYYPQEWPVTLHFAGEVNRDFDTRYIRKENYDSAFMDRMFGGAAHGNLYRGRNPGGPGNDNADLLYRGDDPEEYGHIYEKRTHRDENDFSDVIELTRVFDPAITSADDFPDALEALVDVRQWARFFALHACLVNTDGGIWNNNGEDYFLYHFPSDVQHPQAGKWVLLSWDVEETFTNSDERLFRPQLPAVRRFLTHPRFAPLYYEELIGLREGVFSRPEMRRRFAPVSVMFPSSDVFNVVDPIDAFVARRLGFIDLNVPSRLEAGAGSGLPPGDMVIAPGDVWRFFRGRSQPAGGLDSWTQPGYDDDGWEEGPTGIGYGDGDDATLLTDMQGQYTTVFARRTFDVAAPGSVASMALIMDYDDAFVAFLNGQELLRSANAPAGAVDFQATAESTHEASAGAGGPGPGGEVETFDVSFARGRLVAGSNVLAILGLNAGANSSDFSLIPALTVSETTGGSGPTGGCGDVLYAQGDSAILMGVADPVTTRSVTVNGNLAEFGYITGGDGPYGATWSAAVEFEPGENLVRVDAHAAADGAGVPVETLQVLIRRVEGFDPRGGPLAGNTVWTASGGPYQLLGNVEIPAGSSLTIEPGAVILGNENASLVVRGLLVAEGTAQQPIVFRPYACGERWGGIVFLNTGVGGASPRHSLRYCDFEGGSDVPGQNGFIAPLDSRLTIRDCRFGKIDGNAIDASGSELDVLNSTFRDVFEGIHCTNSTTLVFDCVFSGMAGDSDAIDFDGDGAARSHIEGCLIQNSSDDGIDLGGAAVDVLDNVFFNVADKAISIERNGALGASTIVGNLIFECGTGMALKNGLTITEGHHNTVTRCYEGIRLFAKDNAPDGGHGTFHSNIVWNNAVNVSLDRRSSAEFTFSDIGGDEPWPGEGNLDVNPMFVSPATGDFALQPASPCIGTGFGGSDMGAVPSGGPGRNDFVRADADGNGAVNLTDAVFTLNYLFRGGPAPDCHDRMDGNDDGRIDISDGVAILLSLFRGTVQIPPPFPEPGPDPTPDALPCR